MKTVNTFKLLGISTLLALGLAACDTSPGPAESAGKKIDLTVQDAGKAIGQTVDKVGEKMAVQGEKAEVAMEDTEITTKVKAAIFAEPGLETLQISVDTVKGVVTLGGSVDSAPHSDRAKALAVAVSGVKEVNNQLAIK